MNDPHVVVLHYRINHGPTIDYSEAETLDREESRFRLTVEATSALGCIQSLKCNRNTCPTGITTHDRRLQRGLDPETKSVRVKNFVEKLRYGTGIISHSCGVSHPRALKRYHCRIALGDGKSMPLDERYPVPETYPEYASLGDS